MNKLIWQRGTASITYYVGEGCGCDPWVWGDGPFIYARHPNAYSRHWHTTRFWGRNRTTTECVGLALAWIAELDMAQRRAENEAELAKAEAEALAEFAQDFSGELILP